ncbi:MAG TPA: hypothetical protein VIJ93_02585 [bacterium]
MSFLDGVFGKNKLVDTTTYLSNVTGTLVQSPVPGLLEDGNASAWLLPDNKDNLMNRNKVPNKNGLLEMKIKAADKGKQAFVDALKAIAGQKVGVWGVLINDDAKEGRAEIRPLDVLWTQLPEAKYPAWVGEMRKNMRAPETLSVYKILSASDASTSGKPPRADETRTVKISIPYPPKPGPSYKDIKYEIKSLTNLNSDFQLSNEMVREKLVLNVTLQSAKEAGPTIFIADLAVFWNLEKFQ